MIEKIMFCITLILILIIAYLIAVIIIRLNEIEEDDEE